MVRNDQEVSKGLVVLFSLLAMTVAGLSSPSLSRSDIYKFIDEDGVTHISNVPTDSRYRLWWREATPEQRKEALKSPLFESMIMQAAERHHVESDLIKAVIKAESGFNHRAVSRKGARGLMQLMPGTAYTYRVDDTFDPWSNIDGGVRYLRDLLDQFKGDLRLALAAYNAGENAVLKYNYQVPPYQETQTYVQRVLRYLKKYRSEAGKTSQASN